MHALATYPHLLFATERTLQDVFWCQHTLLLWQAYGCPDRESWPVDLETFQSGSSWDVLKIVYGELMAVMSPNDKISDRADKDGLA